jgi:hypothetical protein
MAKTSKAALIGQIENAVAQDDLNAALALMHQAPDWEDAACALDWRLGWAENQKHSGQWAERQYSHWRSGVMAPQVLGAVRGGNAAVQDALTPNAQTLARLLCAVQRYVATVKSLRQDESSPLPTPLRVEQASIAPGHRPVPPAPAPDERDEIEEIYRWSKGSLLLLGAPGSGKTFKLMEIAEELLTVVRADPTATIPLPLDLADWRLHHTDFAAWVVETAMRTFLIDRQTLQTWLTERRLALLLDSLNAIADDAARAACIASINDFLARKEPPGLVVCSRPQEYAALATRLEVEVAVHVEPLELTEIRAFLLNDRRLASELRSALLADNRLAQLCETPLGFSVVRQAYTVGALSRHDATAATTNADQRQQLIDAYIDSILARGLAGPDPATLDDARRWLGWLASRMTEHQMSLLWFERIQPSWLPPGVWRNGYYALTRICFGLLAGVLGGILVGLGLGAAPENFFRGVVEGMTAAVAGGVAMAIIDSQWQLRFQRVNRQWLRALLNISVVFAVVFLSAFAVFMVVLGPAWCSLFDWGEVDCAIDYFRFAGEAAFVASLAALSFALVFGVESKDGLRSATHDIQCGAVERLDLSRERAVRFGLSGAAMGAVAGAVLIFVDWLQVGSAGNPVLNIAIGWYDWLGGALPLPVLILLLCTATCGAISGVFGSITGMAIYPQSRRRPDQPIWLLLKNAALIGGVGAGVSIPIFWLLGTVADYAFLTYYGLEKNLAATWVYGAFVGFLAFLWYGGLSLFLYTCLRSLLTARADTPPINRYIAFLDAMAELRLLYPVLGGYRFYHPLWQEHFAQTFATGAARRQPTDDNNR